MAGIDPEKFAELATAPKRTSGDEGLVEERSVEELIKADQYAKASQGAGPPFGLRVSKIRFPST